MQCLITALHLYPTAFLVVFYAHLPHGLPIPSGEVAATHTGQCSDVHHQVRLAGHTVTCSAVHRV